MQTVINNVDGAIDFIINAEKEHPNRIDTCRASTSGPLSTSNPLNQGGPANPFLSTQGHNNPFGAPSQPTSTSTSGSHTVTGQSAPFGQPLGGTTPAFGAPSQLGSAGTFGRPSALGQKPNPFGAPSGGALSSTSSGVSAPFSSFTGAGNPFSQPQQQAANPFGAPSVTVFPTSSQAAQQAPFSQTSGKGSNPFASANPPSQQNQFGTNPAPFGAPALVAANPFGQPSTKPAVTSGSSNASTKDTNPFGQAPAPLTANPFGSVQQPAATRSPIDTRQISSHSQLVVNGNALVNPNGSLQHPSLEAYSTKARDGKLTIFKGMRVAYKGDEAGFNTRDGNWQKIWFPQGAPTPYKDTEMDDAKYDDSIKTAYKNLQQSSSFQGGVMPMIPPRREWCTFDF
jgi:nucleoporin NUP42